MPVLLRIPPLLFVAAYLAGTLLERFGARMPVSAQAAAAWSAAGTVLLNGALLLFLWSAGLFWIAGTTILPEGRASRLVTVGPYRVSRNPMYLSLVLAHVGLGCSLAQALPAVLVVVPLWIVNRQVIPHEERALRERFGGRYAEYCLKVPRWI